MKKILLFVIFSIPFIGFSQNKMSFDLQVEAGPVFTRTKALSTYSSGAIAYDPTTGSTIFIPGRLKSANEYKNVITSQFSFGARVNYTVIRNFKIYAVLSFSHINAKRKNTLIIPNSFPNGGAAFNFTTNESLEFYNLNTPLGVTYSQNKWSLSFGIIPTIILNSKFSETKKTNLDPTEITLVYPWTNDPSIPVPSSENTAKSYISLSITPQYQLNKKFKIGLEYSHGLGRSYYPDNYASSYYQSTKTSTFGLKILYSLN